MVKIYRVSLITIIFTLFIYVNAEIQAFDFWIYNPDIPEFELIENVNERKKAFIEYVRPGIEKENVYLLELRKRVLHLKNKSFLSQADKYMLDKLKKKYKIKNTNSELIDELLEKIDIIPTSLALAQAATESGWGRSRFSKKYYNFFGIWCFKKGCGVVPENRDDKKKHEVAKFYSLQDAIRYYMHNLNSHWAYNDFRKIRAKLRKEKNSLNGFKLAEGLLRYSGIENKYVNSLKSIIKKNNLHIYD